MTEKRIISDKNFIQDSSSKKENTNLIKIDSTEPQPQNWGEAMAHFLIKFDGQI